MTYSLKFLPSALEEWENVNNSIKPLLKNKLQQRLNNPHVPASRLRGFENHYKIKLKKVISTINQQNKQSVNKRGNHKGLPLHQRFIVG